MKKLLTVVLILMLMLIPLASATEYIAKIQIQQIIQTDGAKLWGSTQIHSFNTSESWNVMSFTMKYVEPDTESSSSAMFRITSNSVSVNNEYNSLNVNSNACIKGSCPVNATAGDIGDTRIELLSMTPVSGIDDGVSGTDEDIDVYILTNANEKLLLSKDSDGGTPNIYNPAEYNKKTGWQSASNTKEVFVFLKRNKANLVVSDFKIDSSLPYKCEDYPSTNSLKCTLSGNGKYIISMKFPTGSSWVKAETESIYTLEIAGLSGDSSGSPSSSTTTPSTTPIVYSVEKDTSRDVFLSPGTFTLVPQPITVIEGITERNLMQWTVGFSQAGRFECKYKPTSGDQVTIIFNVAGSQSTSSPSATIARSASQTQGTGDTNWLFVILGILIIGIVAAIFLMKRQKGGRRGSRGEVINNRDST